MEPRTANAKLQPILNLECEMWERDDTIQGAFVFNTALFERSTIERIIRHYQTLLDAIAYGGQSADFSTANPLFR